MLEENENVVTSEENIVTPEEAINNSVDEDLAPDYEPQLTEEDLKQTSFEEHSHIQG